MPYEPVARGAVALTLLPQRNSIVRASKGGSLQTQSVL